MSVVRLITNTDLDLRPAPVPTWKVQLREALVTASIAARDFALSDEPIHETQRQQYMALAESLEAQARSLRAEV